MGRLGKSDGSSTRSWCLPGAGSAAGRLDGEEVTIVELDEGADETG